MPSRRPPPPVLHTWCNDTHTTYISNEPVINSIKRSTPVWHQTPFSLGYGGSGSKGVQNLKIKKSIASWPKRESGACLKKAFIPYNII